MFYFIIAHDIKVSESFVNANYVRNVDMRKYIHGYVLTLFGTILFCKTNLQLVVALSTTQTLYKLSLKMSKKDFIIREDDKS